MKIYNRKHFLLGLLFLLLAAALLAVSLWRGFELKGTVLLAACFLYGAGLLIRSLSREMSKTDKIDELDERNRFVKLRARSAAFLWSEGICFVCLLLCMLGRKWLGDALCVPMVLSFGLMLSVMLILELITALYFNRMP